MSQDAIKKINESMENLEEKRVPAGPIVKYLLLLRTLCTKQIIAKPVAISLVLR